MLGQRVGLSLGHNPSEYSVPHVLGSFSHILLRTESIPVPIWPDIFPYNSYSLPDLYFSYICTDQYSAEDLRESSAVLEHFICAALSWIRRITDYSVVCTVATLISLISQLISSTWRLPRTLSLPELQLGNIHCSVSLGNCVAHLVYFHFLGITIFFVVLNISYILFNILVSGWRVLVGSS